MSLYAEYLTERTNDKIIETEQGFATYRHLPEQNATYIVDIYVRPDARKKGLASSLANSISYEANLAGHKKVIGSVVPSAKNSTESLKVLLAYGFKLQSSGNDFIFLEKDI